MSPAVLNHTIASHVEVQKVGPIAQRTGAHKLILTHLIDLVNHPLDSDQWKSWAQQGYDGQVIVGQDLQRIPLI
jgi:ribonuclease BN (tRNA processing enzyme)